MRSALGATALSRAAHVARVRQLKAELTRASFSLGDPSNKVSYDTTLKDASRRPATSGYPIVRPKDFKGSSVYFGNDKPDYRSEAVRTALPLESLHNDNYDRNKSDIRAMKESLLAPNFSLGEGRGYYSTEYTDEYVPLSPECYKQYDEKVKAKALVDDVKKAHFQLGQDTVDYRSNTQLALVGGNERTLAEAKEQQERNKALRQQLQKTSFTIGTDDNDY